MTGPERCYPDTIVLPCGRHTLRHGFRGRDFSDKCLDGEQAVLKCFRRSGIVPHPHRFARCADYKAPDTVNRVEESNKDLLSCSVQCRTRTKLLREYAELKSNCDYQRRVRENCVSLGGGGFRFADVTPENFSYLKPSNTG